MSKPETSTVSKKLTDEEKQQKEDDDYVKRLEIQQYQIRKNPELYAKEVQKYSQDFQNFFNTVKENPLQKNKKFGELSIFLARLAQFFKTDLDYLQNYIQEFMEHYAGSMNPYLRKKLIAAYMIMRAQNLVLPYKALTFLFKLFNIQDKELRKMIGAHIVNDLKRMNKHHKNEKINKQVQNFIFEILKKNSDILAKRSLQLMIQMYKKCIWNDTKTINIISQGCFNDYYKVRLASCHFLIETTEIITEVDTSDEEDEAEVNPREKIGAKKTKARQQKLERDKKKALKKQKKKMKRNLLGNFFPIDQLYNPQDFAEKLFSGLRKNNDRFAVKLVVMQLISRLVGRQKLILISYYSYIQKYLFPYQKEIGKILAFLAEAVHELIPQEDLAPVIKHLVDNFVNQRCSELSMTMGLNTVREMCDRNIYCIDKFTLNYLADYWSYKNRNVSKAAKSLINLFREKNPRLLEKKYRGRYNRDHKLMPTTEEEAQNYVIEKPVNMIDGADLLDDGSEVPIYLDKVMTDEDFRMIKYLKQKKIKEEMQKKYAQVGGEEEEDDDEEEDGEEYDSEDINSDDLEDMEEDDDEQKHVEGENLEEISDSEDDMEDEDEEMSEDDEEQEDDNEEGGDNEEQQKNLNKKRKRKELAKMLEDYDEYDSGDDPEEENPHGFISQEVIKSFRKKKAERKQEQREQKELEQEEKKHGHFRKEKGGGTTNIEKLKSKPMMMVMDKKKKKRQKQEDKLGIKNKIKQLKNQLGHVRSNKQFQNKKKLQKRK